MEPTEHAGIITAQQFEDYSTAWSKLVQAGDTDALTRLFKPEGMQLLTTVTFTMPQEALLLSTVGLHHISARFLYRQDAPEGQAQFTVALYAAAADGTPLSAYYAGSAPLTPQKPPIVEAAIPYSLTKIWQDAWAHAGQLTPGMFQTSYGPLTGYNFELSDFLPALQAAEPFAGKLLYVNFGLHVGFAPTQGDDKPLPMQTFGLLLQVKDPKAPAGERAQVEDLSYDMSFPCPPNP